MGTSIQDWTWQKTPTKPIAGWLIRWIISSKQTSNTDTDKIVNYFNELEFFKDLNGKFSLWFINSIEKGKNIVNDVISRMSYEFMPEGGTVCNYGDKGDTFYVIIQGNVTLKVPLETHIKTKHKDFDNWYDFIGKC